MSDSRSKLEALCAERGLKMTDQRRVIARVLSESSDHPDVEALHKRATTVDANISIATVYRTVRLFEEAGILAKHDFGDGRARYEETPDEHHDHLIDIQSGKVIEFHNDEIEELQRRIRPAAENSEESGFITSLRHAQLLEESREALEQAVKAVEFFIPHEMLLLDLYAALRSIDGITGATTADDILNRIFSTFCIGK